VVVVVVVVDVNVSAPVAVSATFFASSACFLRSFSAFTFLSRLTSKYFEPCGGDLSTAGVAQCRKRTNLNQVDIDFLVVFEKRRPPRILGVVNRHVFDQRKL
jgi:hypothetical protein